MYNPFQYLTINWENNIADPCKLVSFSVTRDTYAKKILIQSLRVTSYKRFWELFQIHIQFFWGMIFNY